MQLLKMNKHKSIFINGVFRFLLPVAVAALAGCAHNGANVAATDPGVTAEGQVVYTFTDSRNQPTLAPSEITLSGITAGEMRVQTGVTGEQVGFSTNRRSIGYPEASGLHNFYVSQLASSRQVNDETPFLSFTLIPDADVSVYLTAISFGVRTIADPGMRISEGPRRFVVRTSADRFARDVITGDFQLAEGDYNFWHHYSFGNLEVPAPRGAPLEVRIYLLEATGHQHGGMFRIDDVIIGAHASR